MKIHWLFSLGLAVFVIALVFMAVTWSQYAELLVAKDMGSSDGTVANTVMTFTSMGVALIGAMVAHMGWRKTE